MNQQDVEDIKMETYMQGLFQQSKPICSMPEANQNSLDQSPDYFADLSNNEKKIRSWQVSAYAPQTPQAKQTIEFNKENLSEESKRNSGESYKTPCFPSHQKSIQNYCYGISGDSPLKT